MGEMAELFLSSQDDIDFYDDCMMQGYQPPSRVYGVLDSASCESGKTYHPQVVNRKSRYTPAGCWVDKYGEVQKISDMSDGYLHNLIRFLEKNPSLIKQNCASYKQMVIEEYKRTNSK